MAQISWKNPVSGTFETAADWSSGTVPGSGDDALLTVAGAAYTVTTTQADTVNSVQLASNATLDVGSGQNFTMNAGTGAGVDAGQINVANNAALYVAGEFDNTSAVATGGVTIDGGVNNTEMRLVGATTTFTGGGKVVMTGTNDFIFGNTSGSQVLDNLNNSFLGVGDIGNGQLTIDNQAAGVFDANTTGQLTLNPDSITNFGTLEATGTGGLFLLNTSVDNTGAGDSGKITATGTGAHVDLQATTIAGGVLTSGAGAWIDVVSGQSANLDGSQPSAPVNITTGTNIDINNNAALYLYGAINNAGAINLEGTANDTELRLVTAVTTLTGAGQIVMSGANDFIFGNGGALNQLANVNNTISGTGNVGDGQMTLLNETAGTIDANQTSGLTVDANGGVTNTGLLEATNTGGLLLLNSSFDNTQGGDAGKITASGAGAHVDLQNSQIYGGTLTTAGTGAVIDVVSGQAAWLIGTYATAPVNIATGSTVLINNNSTLYLQGTINNAGVIDLGVLADPNDTEIRLETPVVTLAGGGTINMANSPNNLILANDTAQETLNNTNNIIDGSGDIGGGQMTMINGKKGVIDANQAPGASGSGEPGQLQIQVNGGVTNNGIMESSVAKGATAGGDLFILNTEVIGTGGGKIEALGAATVGSTVDLQNAYILGGTLTSTKGPSKIEVVSGQIATLDGTAKVLTVSAVFNVLNNSTLYLDGAISTKSGSINVLGGANSTEIRVNGESTVLSGAGKINLSNANSLILANSNVNSLVNTNNTIQGAGDIGDGTSLVLVNETAGVVNANAASALTIQANQTIQNYGLIESATTVTGAGGLEILNSNIDNTVANATGVLNTGKITATGTGHVDLQNSNIYGGTLTSTGSAFFDVLTGQVAGLNGTVQGQAVNIAAGTQFNVTNNSTLYLYGAINNAGTITMNGGANSTDIRLNSSDVVLSGGGKLVLAGGTGTNSLIENQGNALLDNVNNTISGGGQIGGGGAMYLTNESAGVIDATLAGGLAVDLGGDQMINAGTLEATGSNLSVTNSVYNTGSIVAGGGNLTIGGNVNGAGSETISGASTLEIGSSVGPTAAQAVTFASGSTGTFKIDNAQSFTGTVKGLATGNTLDLGNINFATVSLTYSGTTTSGVLTVTDGTTTATISLLGDYTQANFTKRNDGGNHTDIGYTGSGMASVALFAQSAAAGLSGGSAPAGSSSNLVGSSSARSDLLAVAAPH